MLSRLTLAAAFVATAAVAAHAQTPPPPPPPGPQAGGPADHAPPPPPPGDRGPEDRGGPGGPGMHGDRPDDMQGGRHWKHHMGRHHGRNASFHVILGDRPMVVVDCGHSDIKACIDASGPLIDAISGGGQNSGDQDYMDEPDDDSGMGPAGNDTGSRTDSLPRPPAQ